MSTPRLPVPARHSLAVLVLTAGLSIHPSALLAGASTVPSDFSDQQLVGSLDLPVGLAEVPDPATAPNRRILVVEQNTARVKLVIGGSVTTVGTVPGVATSGPERGLLGVTVDPGWPLRPYLYVHCTDGRSGNRIAISRFTATGDLGYTGNGQFTFASTSRYDLITRLPDNASNHNGGTVRFGPDQMLYVSLGDDATGCPAQDNTSLVGKILRLDVSRLPTGAGGPAPNAILAPIDNPFAALADTNAQLVYALGLRNPFRFTIDPATGALFIGDVGENSWEEMDRVPSGGLNIGWPRYEGPEIYTSCAGSPGTLTPPISSYDHSNGLVIIGGPAYRRPLVGGTPFPAAYDGDCFYLDYYSGMMRRLTGAGNNWTLAPPVPGQTVASDWGDGFDAVSDMIELSDGSLVYCRQSVSGASLSGEVRRIIYTAPTAVGSPGGPGLALAAPRPSPSRGSVTMAWSQPARDAVHLAVYDISGRRVRRLVDGADFEAGVHEHVWDGLDDAGHRVGPGLYFVSLTTGRDARKGRITLVR